MVEVGTPNLPLLPRDVLEERARKLGIGEGFIEETSHQELHEMVMKVWAQKLEEEK